MFKYEYYLSMNKKKKYQLIRKKSNTLVCTRVINNPYRISFHTYIPLYRNFFARMMTQVTNNYSLFTYLHTCLGKESFKCNMY